MPLLYAPFTKINQTDDGLIVEGYAQTEHVDVDDQVVDYDSVKKCMPDYAQWGNIREMHQPIAAGKALLITPDDEQRAVFLRALIVDTEAQKKVRAGVYQGFSVGGKASSKLIKRADGSTYTRRYASIITEISLADRPANPETRFSIVKFAGGDMADGIEEVVTPPTALDAETVAAIKKLAGQAPLAKAASDPAKIVALIQAARNELELKGDMDGSAMLTQAISLVQQVIGGAEPAEGSPAEEATESADEAAAEGDPTAVAAAAKPGNLTKAGARIRTTKRLGGVEALAKSLLQLAADMGSDWATKLIKMASAEPSDATMAQMIGAEFTKSVQPIAEGILNVNNRLIKIEAQPAPGGPALRPVPKQIGSTPAAAPAKPPMTTHMREQLDNLQRMARTAGNPTLAKQYDDQYQLIKAQYSEV